MGDGDKRYVDHFPMPMPDDIREKGMRMAAWSPDRSEFYGTGYFIGEELYICQEHGTGVISHFQLDDGKVVYACDIFWSPIDKIPYPVKQHFGIEE